MNQPPRPVMKNKAPRNEQLLVIVTRPIIGNEHEVHNVLRSAYNRGVLFSSSKPFRLQDGRVKVTARLIEEMPAVMPTRTRQWPLTTRQTVVTGAVLAILGILAAAVWLVVQAVTAAASWAGAHGHQIGIGLVVVFALLALAGRAGGTFSGTIKGTWR